MSCHSLHVIEVQGLGFKTRGPMPPQTWGSFFGVSTLWLGIDFRLALLAACWSLQSTARAFLSLPAKASKHGFIQQSEAIAAASKGVLAVVPVS